MLSFCTINHQIILPYTLHFIHIELAIQKKTCERKELRYKWDYNWVSQLLVFFFFSLDRLILCLFSFQFCILTNTLNSFFLICLNWNFLRVSGRHCGLFLCFWSVIIIECSPKPAMGISTATKREMASRENEKFSKATLFGDN